MDSATVQSNPCKVPGHEEQQLIPYICTSQRCDQISRFLCQECLVDFLHSHNGQKPQLLSKEKLSAQFKTNIVELKQKHQQTQYACESQNKETFQIVSEIEFLIQQFKSQLQQQKDQSSDSDEYYFESLNNLITQSFYQLSPDNINKILNISDYKLNTQLAEDLKQTFQDLTFQFETLKMQINSLNFKNSLDSIQINIDDKIKKFKYVEQQIQSYTINKGYCNHLTISPNNQYLAIVYHDVMQKIDEKGNRIRINSYSYDQEYETYQKYYFEVVDLKSKTNIKLKFKNTEIDFLQFSSDSQRLYYQERQEPFCCYQFQNCTLQDYRHFVQLQRIKSILPIQWNRAFVTTYSNQIQLLDMEFQNKLFEIQLKNLIDMVCDNINKFLITSCDTLIEVFDGETGIKINQNCLKLNLSKLQLSDDRTKLFGSDTDCLYMLKIFYIEKIIQIDILQKLKYHETIISYVQAWNQQYIVIFGKYGIVSIYDQNLQILKEFFIGFNGSQRKEINCGQISDDFSEITVTSVKDKVYQRLKLEQY